MFIFADHGIKKNDYNDIKQEINSNILDIISGYIYPHFCFGHDLNVSRLIVFDMLNNNIINNKDILIVTDDRQFLYNQIFTNLINFKDFIKKYQNNVNENNFIFLPPVVTDLVYWRKNNYLEKFNYDVYNKDYWNDKLVSNIKNINKFKFDSKLESITSQKFFIFIIRTLDHSHFIFNPIYIDYLKKIIDVKGDLKLILYCAYLSDKYKIEADYTINNIHALVTLLQCKNCVYLIGETSGLMEVSYYYHHDNLKILQFPLNHQQLPLYNNKWLGNDDFKDNIGNMKGWNRKYISPINHNFYYSFNEIINDIQANTL